MHFTSIFMDRWITVKMLCKKGLMFLRYIYITAFYFFLLSYRTAFIILPGRGTVAAPLSQ